MSQTKDAVVRAESIVHVYGEGDTAFKALKGVSIEANKGELLLLMGPSGSGKTTLLQILGFLLRPTEGKLWLNGRELGEVGRDELGRLRLRHFGFVFQAYNLFPTLTAAENVAVALDLQGLSGKAARERARELLVSVGLEQRVNAYPAQLSGGQKQRVAIARALAADPEVILADEPTAALDSTSGAKVVELFRDLADRQGRAVVIVTHDPRILSAGERIVTLEDGQIVDADADDHHRFQIPSHRSRAAAPALAEVAP
jgi:putative ABC transport system ATP-binding protein